MKKGKFKRKIIWSKLHSRHVNDNVKGDIIESLDGIIEAHIVSQSLEIEPDTI